MTRVAVVGAGPAGVYAADGLIRHGGISVDVLDRLPCPFGLVRYGVAPDHLKIKSVSVALAKVLEAPNVRFLGNVDLGGALRVDELRRSYDAVIYASGAAVDRRLGIPGEDLAGSFSATEFVAWYCGHPDAAVDRFTLDARSVVVAGVGNVAVDVVRILAKDVAELRPTDLSDHALDVLAASRVEDIHMVGRRGPAQAKFTTKELRELGELAGADVVVHPDELVLDEASEAALSRDAVVRRNLDVLREWAIRPLAGRARRIHLRFLLRPVAVLGEGAVAGVSLERMRLDGSGNVVGTGTTTTIEAQLLLRAVGYRGRPIEGVPFDEQAGVIPHQEGRVLRGGVASPGEYVVGWIKRGPTGVIGTNKSDAQETVQSLLADLPGLVIVPDRDPDALIELLRDRGVPVIDWAGWRAIDVAELTLGQQQGRTRVKIAERAELLAAAASAHAPATASVPAAPTPAAARHSLPRSSPPRSSPPI